MLDEQAPSSSILRTCTRSLVAAQPAVLAVTDLAPALEVPEPRTRPARFRGTAAGEPRVVWHERRIATDPESCIDTGIRRGDG